MLTRSAAGHRSLPRKKPARLKHPEQTPVLKAALSYADLGWHVLPIYGAEGGHCLCSKGAQCESPGKHPMTPNGVKDATIDPDIIRNWFPDGTKNNIGIATGNISGLLVIDVDPKNGGSDSLAALLRIKKYPRTARCMTGGGGKHIYFAYPSEGIKTSHSKVFGPGIDVQSDGAYVVAPPSIHASGNRYAWFPRRSPETRSLAGMPDTWLHRAKSPLTSAMPEGPDERATCEGSRNTELARLAGKYVNVGLSEEEILDALLAKNQRACVPPLDESEVKAIAASISRYPAHPPDADEAETLMSIILDQRFAKGATLVYAPDGQFWHFDKTHWKPLSDKVLSGIILAQAQAYPRRKRSNTSSLINQVLTLTKAKVARADDLLRFEGDPPQVINCLNGELWIKKDGSVEKRPHDSSSYLRHCFRVEYDPSATCSRYQTAITEIFSKSTHPRALVDCWHDIMGYAIQPSRKIPMILMARGDGNDGKTKLVETLIRLLGSTLVAALPIQSLEKDKFTIGNLLGKFIYLEDDMQSGVRLPDGPLKKISEEKTLTGEIKFGKQFTFTARLLPILLCNHPPSIADLSFGMRRRLHVIPFERSFSEEEADLELFPTIWGSEMSGILNLYLAGLKRVIQRGWHFAYPASVTSATMALIRAANPVPEFIETMCRRDVNASCLMKDLYVAYCNWAKESGISYTQQRLAFSRNVESCGFNIKRANAVPKVVGLRLKSPPASQDSSRRPFKSW